MTDIEHSIASHTNQEDVIDEVVKHDAGMGRKVLQHLSKTEQQPSLTFRNVIKATDAITMINCVALTLCYFSAIMAFTVPPSQIIFIVQDTSLGETSLSSWVSTAATAATAAVLPSMSSLTDVLGRRYALLIGCALGVAGALLSGLAKSVKVIMIGQALSGAAIGFAFISAAALAEIVPAFTRPFWGTLQHTAGAIGQVLGPVYAGAFVKADMGGWRWTFYINAILYGITFVILLLIYKPNSRVKALGLTNKEVAKRFDYVGLLLFVGGTVAFLIGLAWGGDINYGWKSAHALAPTIIGLIALIIVLPLYEGYVAKYPLIDRRLLKNRNFVVLNVQTFVIGFVQFSSTVYLPQILFAFWEKDPLLLGVDRIPLFGSVVVGQTLSGFVFQRTGRYKWQYVFYAFLLFLGPTILAVLRPGQPIGVPLGLSIFTGLGIGGPTQLGLIAIQYSIPQQLLGISMGSLNTIRSFGGAIGVAIYSSILSSKENSDMPGAITAAALGVGAPQSEIPAIVNVTVKFSAAAITKAANGNVTVVDAVLAAYNLTLSNSYRVVFLATIPFGVISLLICFFLQEVTEYMSEETVFGVKREIEVVKKATNEKETGVEEANHVEESKVL